MDLAKVHDYDVIVQETSYGTVKNMWRLSDEGIKEFYGRNGYGGTNMRPGIDAFLEQWEFGGEFQVSGVIVMSDGELGTDSIIKPEECHLPLLWLFTRDRNPFKGKPVAGEVLYMNKK